MYELRLDDDSPTLVSSALLIAAWGESDRRTVTRALALPVNDELVIMPAHPKVTVKRVA